MQGAILIRNIKEKAAMSKTAYSVNNANVCNIFIPGDEDDAANFNEKDITEIDEKNSDSDYKKLVPKEFVHKVFNWNKSPMTPDLGKMKGLFKCSGFETSRKDRVGFLSHKDIIRFDFANNNEEENFITAMGEISGTKKFLHKSPEREDKETKEIFVTAHSSENLDALADGQSTPKFLMKNSIKKIEFPQPMVSQVKIIHLDNPNGKQINSPKLKNYVPRVFRQKI